MTRPFEASAAQTMDAIVPAAGHGRRLKNKIPKPFISVLGQPLLVRTLRNLLRAYPFREMVVMIEKNHLAMARKVLNRHHLTQVLVAEGGATRAHSVKKGLGFLSTKSPWVLIHDGARPLVNRTLVLKTLKAARPTGAALCAVPVTATVKRVRPGAGQVRATEDRRSLVLAQTPQIFRKDLLWARYRALGEAAMKATDEAALFDGSAVPVGVASGDVRNLKVTTREDLELLKYYLK